VTPASPPSLDELLVLAAPNAPSPPPDDAGVDRLYPRLVRHKVLTQAMVGWEEGGADLDVLGVAAHVYRSAWPLPGLLPHIAPGPDGRVPLGAIRNGLAAGRDRIWAAIDAVRTASARSIVLAFGRAFEAGYPGYRHRMSYDADLATGDLDGAVDVVRALTDSIGQTLYRCRVSRQGGAWFGVFNTFGRGEDGFEVHVDLLAGGVPTGPGLLMLWYPHRLGERWREVVFEGRTVRVPTPEDMLLTVAAVRQRKAEFIARDLLDARTVLSTDGAGIDWDDVVTRAFRHRLQAALGQLVAGAERAAGRELVPSAVRRGLRPGALERRVLAATARDEEGMRVGTGRSRLRRGLLGLWPSVRAWESLRSEAGVVGATRRMAAQPRLDRGLRRRVRSARVGQADTGRRALELGSLCELRPVPSAPPGFCLSKVVGVRERALAGLDADARTRLGGLAELLPDRVGRQVFEGAGPSEGDRGSGGGHRCRAFVFSLDGPPPG
jgi:hypothetical protein